MMSLLADALAPVFRGTCGQKVAPPATSGSLLPPSGGSASNKRVRGLPEIDYPSPFVVRNTFIDAPCEPSSLDGFFEAREVQSCPTSGICGVPSEVTLPAWKPSELLSRMPEDDGSARSRSTSASGRSSPTESEELDASSSEESPATFVGSSKAARRGLPDFDYPSPFLVKNTFIDTAEQPPFSLVGFFEERRTASCPCSGVALVGAQEAGDSDNADFAGEADADEEADAEVQWPAGIPPPPPAPPVLVASQELPAMPPPPPAPAPKMADPGLFSAPPGHFMQRQAPALWNPEPRELVLLGSPEMPTLGSEAHRFGNCKPCAYAHSKGCGNGVQCPFCHLCPAGELKRRQKAKRSVQRAALAAEARYR